jgi:hypothetical protein
MKHVPDKHCTVFTIRHVLPHRSTLSPTSLATFLAPVASHENLLPTTKTRCLYLPPQFRDLFEEIPESKGTLRNGFKVY